MSDYLGQGKITVNHLFGDQSQFIEYETTLNFYMRKACIKFE